MTHLITTTVLNYWTLGRKTKNSSSGWISGNAPCCHHRGETQDKRGRGGIRLTDSGFNFSCFNCGFKAGWSIGKLISPNTRSLMTWLGMNETEIGQLSFEALREKDALPKAKRQISFDLHDESLPDQCLKIEQWITEGCNDLELIEIVNYLDHRGMSLNWYDWMWSAAPGYRDRVIIPFYNHGHIVGWTGRKIYDGKPKYLTTTQPGYVFNMDAQTYDRKFVIVVEGQFDAIAIDGVAIMHNEPNDTQCARINMLNKEVIVVPDRDRPGAKLVKSALKNNWNVSIPPWGDNIKDVADAVKQYGRLYTLNTILYYREHNQIKIELAKKKLETLNE